MLPLTWNVKIENVKWIADVAKGSPIHFGNNRYDSLIIRRACIRLMSTVIANAFVTAINSKLYLFCVLCKFLTSFAM